MRLSIWVLFLVLVGCTVDSDIGWLKDLKVECAQLKSELNDLGLSMDKLTDRINLKVDKCKQYGLWDLK